MKTEATSTEKDNCTGELLQNYFDNAAYENEDDYLKPAGSRYAGHAEDYGQTSAFHMMLENDLDDDRN